MTKGHKKMIRGARRLTRKAINIVSAVKAVGGNSAQRQLRRGPKRDFAHAPFPLLHSRREGGGRRREETTVPMRLRAAQGALQ